MSIRPKRCEKCEKECGHHGVRLHAGRDEEATYAVSWRCAGCDYKTIDVCPVGPLVPDGARCLNCGGPYPSGDEARCGRCGLARDAARKFLGLAAPPADAVDAGRELLRRGLYRRGLAVLNEALQRDASLERAWLLKCSFLEGLGLHELAAKMLEGAMARGGPSSLLINYGSALHRLGRSEEAAAAARRYLDREPDGRWAAAARTNLALALRKLGDDDGAEGLFREAIRRQPGHVIHYRNLAQLLMDQRRWAGALGVLEAGLARATTGEDRVLLLEALAFVYAEEERAEPALRHIDQALALGAGGVRARYLRGRALALLGRLDEARAEISAVLAKEPDNADARRALEMLGRKRGLYVTTGCP
jgi:tetratricopeptide (TPR) repeat protein